MPKTKNNKPGWGQLERVREIHRRIKRHCDYPNHENLRVTATSLAAELSVTDRQIRRDLVMLDRMLLKGDAKRSKGSLPSPLHWAADERSYTYTREVDLSDWLGGLDDQALGALLVAQQSLAVFAQNPLAADVKRIIEDNTGGAIGNVHTLLSREITNLVSFHPDGAGKIDPVVFATLFNGLLHQNEVKVTYQSKARDKPIERTLRPYHLCCYKQQWRLIAHDSLSKEVRVFVVTPQRMPSAAPTITTFQRPTDFNAREELPDYKPAGPGGQKVRLRISKAGAHHLLEREWCALERSSKKPDGAIEAEFCVIEYEMGEFKRFVLSFGSDCEVLAPPDFREEILEEARKVLQTGKA